MIRVALLAAAGYPITTHARPFVEQRTEVVMDPLGRTSVDALQAAQPDLIIAAAYEHLIGPRMRATARLGAVGLHPSLLPRYRGSYPIWWALRNGEREVGLSLYHLTDGIDAGNVIAQRSVTVERGDTFAGLYDRVAAQAPALLEELLDAIEATGVVPAGTPQDESIATVYSTPGLVARAWVKAKLSLSR